MRIDVRQFSIRINIVISISMYYSYSCTTITTTKDTATYYYHYHYHHDDSVVEVSLLPLLLPETRSSTRTTGATSSGNQY